MKTETKTTFIADDGHGFTDEVACRAYEEQRSAFRSLMIEKIGEYEDRELMLGGHAMLDELPFKAPWMSAFGSGFINVTDVRRTEGNVEFQLAGEDCVPYENGNAWCMAGHFYSEWPD